MIKYISYMTLTMGDNIILVSMHVFRLALWNYVRIMNTSMKYSINMHNIRIINV